jgi:hypothetical protein
MIAHESRPGSLQGKFIMSLTYGYDLNDGDDFVTAPILATEIMSRVMLPGAALVNHVPFCAVLYFITALPVSHSYFQCGTFIPGFRFSATID